LRWRSLRVSGRCDGVSRVRSSSPASVLRGARCRASSSAWLKPRSCRRWRDSGMGSSNSPCSSAGSIQGTLRISVAKNADAPGLPLNL
jgi:hypothetical protein